MPLTLENRRVGAITVVTCAGRIVEGAESLALQTLLDQLLAFGPNLLLHLGAVDFVDSSGLGLLARYTARTRNANGSLKLCGVSNRLVEALKITHLDRVFEIYASEEEAITAFHQGVGSSAGPARLDADILCVDASLDVQALVRELLGQAGYPILTAGNLPDGLILLQATRPTLVIMSPELRARRDTHAAEKFNRLVDAVTVIELAPDFARSDAVAAGSRLLEQVRAVRPVS